jgi:hypothetical protein
MWIGLPALTSRTIPRINVCVSDIDSHLKNISSSFALELWNCTSGTSEMLPPTPPSSMVVDGKRQ